MHNPDFQNDYHKKVVLPTIKILSESKCLRVQLECCDVLDCFIEHMTNSDAAFYLKDSLEILFKSEIIKFTNFSIVVNSLMNPSISATVIYAIYLYFQSFSEE